MFAANATLLTRPAVPSHTKSLLHFDGSNNSTTITDECGITWTNPSGMALSTTASKFGTASLRVPLNNNMLYSSNAVFDKAGLVPWTAECWFRVDSTSVWSSIMTTRIADVYCPFSITASNTAKIEVAIGNAALSSRSTYMVGSVSANTWYHIAVVADGTNITTYLNGTSINSVAHPNWSSGAGYQAFGTVVFTAGPNYVDEFRYSNSAFYAGDFTPPTAPFTTAG